MNWMKYRLIYFALSLLVIVPGLYSLVRYGLKLSIEFTGGSVLVYENPKSSSTLLETFKDYSPQVVNQEDNKTTIRLKNISQEEVDKLTENLNKESSNLKLISFETQGPIIGQETVKKTIYAILLASVLLLFHISRSFKQIKYGVCALLAMLHDSLVLLGTFSLLGHFFQIETDLLFVTAVLTVLSFSVHDTIVVYDRIRELQRKHHLANTIDLANRAVSETMVRSLVNSLTIIFMLLALVLIGGITTRNFALALLIGSISGAYSSPFTAVPLLITWDELRSKLKS